VTERSHRLVGIGVLVAAFVGSPASAQPAAGKPEAKDASPGARQNAEVKAESAGKKAEKAAGQADAPKGMPGNRASDASPAKPGELRNAPGEGRARADAKAANAGEPMNAPRGMGPGTRPGGMRALREGIKNGSIKKEELKSRLDKLRETEQERRREHQRLVAKRWGAALALTPARQELSQHARRTAFLERALLVAQTEAKPADQQKLSERIEMLIDKENIRHERAMMKLSSAPTAPDAASDAMAPVPDPAGTTPGSTGKPDQGGVK
jgi:hypothetical protein